MQEESHGEGDGGGSVPRMQQEQLRSVQGSVLQDRTFGCWAHQHRSQAVSTTLSHLLTYVLSQAVEWDGIVAEIPAFLCEALIYGHHF